MADVLGLDEGNITGQGKRPSTIKPQKQRLQTVEEFIHNRVEEWTVYSASQSLTSALNDPSCRELDLFVKTWGESFIPHAPLPPSDLPIIEISDFLRYLKETASGRKSHRAIVRELEKQNSNPSTPTSPAPRRQLQLDGRVYDLNNIPKIYLQKDFSLTNPRTFLQVIPLSQLLPPSLTPPSTSRSHEDAPEVTTTVIQSSKLLHEKVHLAHQISRRSDLFFSTLASQRELESLIMQTRQNALELRHKIRLMDKKLTHPSLRVFYLKRQNIRRLLVSRQLQEIATVHQTQQTIQLLLRTSDFVGALELIFRTQNILATDLKGVICLRHLSSQLKELEKAIEAMMENDLVHVAMDDLNARLLSDDDGRLRNSITNSGMDTEIQLESVVKGLLRRRKLHFLSPLREHLLTSGRNHVKKIVEDRLELSDEGKTNEEETPPKLATQMRSMEFNDWFSLIEKLFSSLLTYMRCAQKMLSVITFVCQDEAGLLTPTPNTTPITTPTTSLFSMASHPLSVASSEEGMKGNEVFGDESEADARLDQLLMDEELSDVHLTQLALSSADSTTQQDKQEETDKQQQIESNGDQQHSQCDDDTKRHNVKNTKQSTSTESGLTSDEFQKISSDCREIVCELCDVLHSRCTKILNMRAKVGLLDNLHPADFMRLVRLIGQFVNSSAGITGRSCPHLRLALFSQAKKFLETFHGNKKDKLRRLLDGERWRQADVPLEVQNITAKLEEGMKSSDDKTDSSDKPGLMRYMSQHNEQFLTVHGQRFAVVGVLCILITMINEYCQSAEDLPMLITDILVKLVDLLKFFNAYTCQLVLGAGAVEVVGLKTITTRHLAIVLRCLQAIMLIIQDVKAHFRKKLTLQKCILLLQFDQVNEDIGSHCREINQKIIVIMDESIGRLIAKWEVKSPAPSQSFKSITKQLLKLYEALDDLLPIEHLQALFQSIESNFKTHLKNHLNKMGITNNGSNEHGIVHSELTHMKGTLQPLELINVFGSGLFDIWTDSINR